jgi:hypothetical protein
MILPCCSLLYALPVQLIFKAAYEFQMAYLYLTIIGGTSENKTAERVLGAMSLSY